MDVRFAKSRLGQTIIRNEMKAKSSGSGVRPALWIFVLVLLLAGATAIGLSRLRNAEPRDGVAIHSDDATPAPDATASESTATLVAKPEADELRLRVGGTEIVLDRSWQRLAQPETFFVQQRAAHQERGIAMSAGAIRIDLPLEQYVTLGLAGVISGPEKQLDRIAQLVGIPRSEVERTLESQIGRQTMEQLKQASRFTDFELLDSTRIEIADNEAFEIHSKATVRESGQTLFSRQFVYRGTVLREIVQITFASQSEGIFQDKELFNAIRKPSTKALARAARQPQNATEEVKASFQRYTEALLKGDGETAWSLVDSGTQRFYSQMPGDAVSMRRDQLQRLDYAQKMQVLRLRAEFRKQQLESLSGRDVFVLAITNGWISKSAVQSVTTLQRVSVNGRYAVGYIPQDPKAPFYFIYEDAQWKLSLWKLFEFANAITKQMKEESGLPDEEFLLALMRQLSKYEVNERILDGPIE